MDAQTKELQTALGNSVTWVFASALDINPYQGPVWILDPPVARRRLGSALTSDRTWADTTMAYLDFLVLTQGPFDGMVGYSQGGAMTVLYAAQRPLSFIVTFCGYLTTTHTGLLDIVTENSPFATPAFFFAGGDDPTMSPNTVKQAQSHFNNSIFSVGEGVGHAVPTTGLSFDAAVAFILGHVAGR